MELPKATGKLIFHEDLCEGCNTCETACSLFHEGACGHGLSRVQILTYPYHGNRNEVILCKQCDAPNCLTACPNGSLYADEKTGARVISEEDCIACGLCAEACPQYPNTPIRYHSGSQTYIKCDLCGGDPQCVKFCPHGGLSFEKVN